MVCSFLEDKDYEKPEEFIPTAKNTITVPFKMSERYPNFKAEYIDPALAWWHKHVVGGISPEYDEKADADILKVLRTNNLNPETDIQEVIAEAEKLKAKIDKVNADELDEDTKKLKNLNEQIKKYAMGKFRDGDKKVTLTGSTYEFSLSRSDSTEIDKDKLKADGLLGKYSTTKTTYTLKSNLIKKQEDK